MTFKSRIIKFCSLASLIKSVFTAVVPQTANTQAFPQFFASPPADDSTMQARSSSTQYIYAIAHRVLSIPSLTDAIADGANAIEIDATAWSDQWYADHNDPLGTSKGDTIETMFKKIADLKTSGSTISFVWLDIKNPDYCDADDESRRHVCSIIALRDLARKYLGHHGIKVLYGFEKSSYAAYKIIKDGLEEKYESIGLDGSPDDVQQQFADDGPSKKSKRVFSRGFDFLEVPGQFGNCKIDDNHICGQLHKAVDSKYYHKVFGWTIRGGQGGYVERLLDVGVDGLIYGLAAGEYRSTTETRAALEDIRRWVGAHSSDHKMAGNKEW